MVKAGFAGFPPEAYSFFKSLKRNNNREWFRARKDLYERHVRMPAVQFVETVNVALARFAPAYVTEPGQAIYRVYRDTRFSHDKTPYKTHVAALFRRRELEKHMSASLYVSVAPDEVEVAGGIYMPGPEQLLDVRKHLAEHHTEFRRILARKKLRTLMGELWGEQMSRVPKGFPSTHPAADLLRYRQWLVYVMLDPAVALTPQFASEIIDRFRVMLPFVEFLNKPLLAGKRARPEPVYFD